MKTLKDIKKIIEDVNFKDWQIYVNKSHDSRMYLQIIFTAPCVTTKEMLEQKCRKWWLSPYMTETEIVGTAYKAVVAAMDHEVREHFTYKNRTIYNPHFEVNDLIKLSDKVKLDARANEV